jgi:hypothetical protein
MEGEEGLLAFPPTYRGKKVTLISKGSQAQVIDVTDRHEHEEDILETTSYWLGGTRERTMDSFLQEESSKGAHFDVTEEVLLAGKRGVIIRNIHSTAPRNLFSSTHGRVAIQEGVDRYFWQQSEHTEDFLWQKQSNDATRRLSYHPSVVPGTIEVDADEVLLDVVCGKTLDFVKRMPLEHGRLIYNVRNEEYSHDSHTARGLSEGLSALVSIGVGILTEGVGSSILGASSRLGTAMADAGFSSLCSRGSVAMLSNDGDPARAAKAITNPAGLRSLATAMLSAGTMHEISSALQLPGTAADRTFSQHLQYNIAHAGVDAVLHTVIDGKESEATLLSGLAGAVVDSVGAVAAEGIGDLRATGAIDPITHKVLHAGIGMATGALSGDPLSGAIGASVAEFVAEQFTPANPAETTRAKLKRAGHNLTFDEASALYEAEQRIYNARVASIANRAKFVAAATAFVAHRNVEVAAHTASTALEHNYKPHALQSSLRGAVWLMLLQQKTVKWKMLSLYNLNQGKIGLEFHMLWNYSMVMAGQTMIKRAAVG